MSRKPASPPDTNPFTVAKAIGRALRQARERGETPVEITIAPELRRRFSEEYLGNWWGGPSRYAMFGLPVRVDRHAEGWRIRVR